jgi:ABC-type dipeptide/oligopeptide/nickel transport system ATPase subunit
VTRESAVLGIPCEEDTCLNADHSSIVQFQNANDENFKRVLSKLRKLVSDIKRGQEMLQPNSQVQVHATPYFVGRVNELSLLRTWFLGSRHSSRVVALWGTSGVGKSQLAMKFAHVNHESYDHILFVDAASLEVLQNDFTKLQASLSIPGDTSNSVESVVNWLLQNSHQRWLLILDGANHFQPVVSIISRLVHSGHILITTVDASLRGHEFIQESLDLSVLSPKDSMQLLFARAHLRAPKKSDISEAESLLEAMGHLPLAIDSAGAYINVQKKSVREYATLFHDNRFQKEILNHRPQEALYKRSVMNALELSIKEIDNRPDARLLLSLLIFLDRAEVTQDFLKRGSTKQLKWSPSGEPIDVDPAKGFISEELIMLLNNEIRLDKAVEVLVKFSIIKIRRTDNGRAFEMHPLHQKCAKIRMSREQRRKYSVQALFFLAHAFPCDEYVLDTGCVNSNAHECKMWIDAADEFVTGTAPWGGTIFRIST